MRKSDGKLLFVMLSTRGLVLIIAICIFSVIQKHSTLRNWPYMSATMIDGELLLSTSIFLEKQFSPKTEKCLGVGRLRAFVWKANVLIVIQGR